MRVLKVLIYEPNEEYIPFFKSVLETLGHNLTVLTHTVEDTQDAFVFEPIDLAILHTDVVHHQLDCSLGTSLKKSLDIPILYTIESSSLELLDPSEKRKEVEYISKPNDSVTVQSKITSLVFCTKPSKKDLQKSQKMGVEDSEKMWNDSIFIKKEGNFYKINFKEIYYIKSDNVYLEVYTSQGMFLVRSTLKEYLHKLPNTHFYRAHKSYVVNLNYIEAIHLSEVTLRGIKIPISKSFKLFITNAINL